MSDPRQPRVGSDRGASTYNLVQEYIYEIICIKILAPIFTNALILFLHAGLIFLQRLSWVNGRRGAPPASDGRGLFFIVIHF